MIRASIAFFFIFATVAAGDAVADGAAGAPNSTPTCGRAPPPRDCNDLVCLTADRSWDYRPWPAGTPCQNNGTCTAAGVCFVPQPISPGPSITTLDGSTPERIGISYTCGNNADSTVLYRSSNGNAYTAIGQPLSCPGRSVTLWDTSILPGIQQCYEVFSQNALYQVWSPAQCVTGADDLSAPTAPTGGVGTLPGGSIKVFWYDHATTEWGYHVYYRKSGTVSFILRATLDNPQAALHLADETYGQAGPAIQYTITGLEPNVLYDVMVEAYQFHAPKTTSLVMGPYMTLPPVPTAPSDAQVVHTTVNQIWLGWTTPLYPTAYKVEWASMPGTAPTGKPLGCPAGKECVSITDLAANTQYCVKITAWNQGGTSAPSAPICGTTSSSMPMPQGVSLALPPRTTTGGQTINVGSIPARTNSLLQALELYGPDNIAELGGLILVPSTTSDSSTCSLSTPGAVFVDPDGWVDGDKLATVYGTAQPILDAGLGIRVCPLFEPAPATAPTITVIAHESTP